MLVCPLCQSQQLEGTFFCTECGGSLLPNRKRDVTTSLGAEMSWSVDAPSVAVAPPAQAPAHNALRLTILNSGRRLSLSLDQPIVIGRQDSRRGFYPDIDLSGDGGVEGGVSRRHARLSLHAGQCYVEDLESANGTFINQRRLAPHTPQPLGLGDEFRVGTLVIRVEML